MRGWRSDKSLRKFRYHSKSLKRQSNGTPWVTNFYSYHIDKLCETEVRKVCEK